MPVELSITSLDAELLRAGRDLEPASRDAIKEALETVLDTLNAPTRGEAGAIAMAEWWKRAERQYVDALADLPGWAVARACTATVRSTRTRDYMPRPADILRHVEEELAVLHTARARLRTARMMRLRQQPTGGGEAPKRDMVGLDEMMQTVRRALGGQDRTEMSPETSRKGTAEAQVPTTGTSEASADT